MNSYKKVIGFSALVCLGIVFFSLFFSCSHKGCIQYYLKNYEESYEIFRSLSSSAALYNAGNAAFQIGEEKMRKSNSGAALDWYLQSKGLYEESLRLPNAPDTDAKKNIAIVQKKIDTLSPKKESSQDDSKNGSGSTSQTGTGSKQSQEELGLTDMKNQNVERKFWKESDGKIQELTPEEYQKEMEKLDAFQESMNQFFGKNQGTRDPIQEFMENFLGNKEESPGETPKKGW